ncbi:high-potential iron-sulfur protein [Endozoicomonas sp. SESOKO1]|uniref:high-potential iron-sulfur protein n=1 Tax=Endozoicomonas sp. SESOKO1 TaxID=2828742 RepID=UPI00214783BD|nr:high-potential iron-sulfur protein [Endozoicomonas sp. SESOKO1]
MSEKSFGSAKLGPTRRRFLQLAAASALIPMLYIPSRQARADALPALDESNPTAMGLAYKKTQEAAKSIDGYQEGRKCENCALYTPENQGCRLFPANSVAPEGWCKAWVPKPA